MSFPHELTLKRSSLVGVSYEQPVGDFLTGPKNLTGTVVNEGSDGDLKWDPPDTEVAIMGYEVFVDGSFHDTAGRERYLYEGLVNGIQTDFKVRAIGPLGIKSSFSNTATLEGGGLPEMDPFVYGNEFKAGSIVWRDVSGHPDYTIEGYNVYACLGTDPDKLTKQNSSLLPLSVLTYTFFDPGFEQDFLMGVSFEYDGGQESAIFHNQGTSLDDNSYTRCSIVQRWDGYYPVVACGSSATMKSRFTGDEKAGVRVEPGTNISILSRFSPGNKEYWKEWTSPEGFDYLWTLQPREGSFAVITFHDGCLEDRGFHTVKVFDIPALDKKMQEGDNVQSFIAKGFYDRDEDTFYSMNFLWSGPTCEGQSIDTYITYDFVLQDKVIQETAYYSDNNYSFVALELPNEARLDVSDDASGKRLSWHVYKGAWKYELYIRTKGSSTWGSADYTEAGRHINGYYTAENLAADTYEAKVRFLQEDESTYYTTESNVVEFMVS